MEGEPDTEMKSMKRKVLFDEVSFGVYSQQLARTKHFVCLVPSTYLNLL
jgi:hypothetical protein